MKVRQCLLAPLVVLMLSGGTPVSSDTFPSPGEWSCFRRDGSLTTRSPLKANISNPSIQWKHFVGVVDTTLIITPTTGERSIKLPLKELSKTGIEDKANRWGMSQPLAEYEGKIQPLNRTRVVEYADIFSDVPGLEKIESESGFDKPVIDGQWQPASVRCFAWKDGRWVQVWETEPIQLNFHALPIAGDFDADGHLEIAILPWNDLLILDATTGKIKDQCTFTKGRSYGFMGAYDLDEDGKTEFVVQADYSKHVDVLGYKDGKLSLFWRKEIELGFEDPQKVLRVKPDPVADVDGDGKLEVLINLYNGDGDRRWHVTVHDGITGAVKAELVDECLKGLVDVDGDGATELLTTRTSGGAVPEYGPISVWSMKGESGIRRLWQSTADTGWQEWERPMHRHVSSRATLGQTDVLYRQVDDRMYVALRRADRSDQSDPSDKSDLILAVWTPKGFETKARVSGSSAVGFALDAQGNMLVKCTSHPTKGSQVSVTSGTAEVVFSQQRPALPIPLVVVREKGDKIPTVIAQGAGKELVAFRASGDGKSTAERWRIPGWGQCTGWTDRLYGPVVADLYGNRRRQHIYASSSPEGCARLIVADMNGKEIWHRDFPKLPGDPPPWNIGGITQWQVGHFTNKQKQDVLVTTRRSVMHSEETMLLSGRDGKILWHRDHQICNRGVGGKAFAIADFNGDGYEDASSLNPNIFYILDGRTGKDIVAKLCEFPNVPSQLYWGLTVAGDFDGDGQVDAFFDSDRAGGTGVLHVDGTLVWVDAVDKSPKYYHAYGDFDGDGRTEAIGIGYLEDGIRCYDTATGNIEWRMPMPAKNAVTGTASADLNSDGKDEAIFTIGNTLYCVGTDTAGKGYLLWKVSLPSRVGPPSIADVDGTGTASILLLAADGYVYCLK